MSEPKTLSAAEVVELLAVICEALTVPYPAATAGRGREWLLVDRTAAVKAVIRNITEDRLLSEVCGPAWWAEHLRGLTAEQPVTYPVQESKEEVGA